MDKRIRTLSERDDPLERLGETVWTGARGGPSIGVEVLVTAQGYDFCEANRTVMPIMLGLQIAQPQMYYDFWLDDHVPTEHLLLKVDALLHFGAIRPELATFLIFYLPTIH